MTPGYRRALEIIRDDGPISPSRFAEKMWPDSPHWQESYKCGQYGSTRGRGVVLAGGSLMGKLRTRGWVTHPYARYGPDIYDWYTYVLTTKGQDALQAVVGEKATT